VALIVDDTGFPKQGKHSVGVARQYCGQLGKQDNCQVAVSLSVSTWSASLPIAWRLYLPEVWCQDPERCQQAGVPKEIEFQTKPEIALQQIRQAKEQEVPIGVVLTDAGYGNGMSFRTGVTQLGLQYAVGIESSTSVWEPGLSPLPVPSRKPGRGAPPKRLQRDADHQPVSVKQLALDLPSAAWKNVAWRQGVQEKLSSRFAAVRVRPAHRDYKLTEPHAEEWLLIEWPKGEKEPTKYWLSTLPADIAFERLVDLTKLRWRIERDYQELKQEFGLGHYEGRGWRGFHHHATLCIAAYGFLISETETIPPSGPRAAGRLPQLAVPAGYRPRGAPDKTRTPHSRLDRNPAAPSDHRTRQGTAKMSLLRAKNPTQQTSNYMTQ
jgi:SRSO17 transposase